LNDPRVIRPRERDGFGFQAQWNDDFHHALHAALTRESHGYYCDFVGVEDLACVFSRPFLFAGRFSPYRLRSHGRRVEEAQASSFIAYSQNHDQVGNRATGERLHQLLPIDEAKIAAALTILSPYVPMLFQGEEWAASSPFQYFVDFSDEPELAKAVSEGRRKEFVDFHQGPEIPDPQSLSTFQRSKLDWNEIEEPTHLEMLKWYRDLIALRRRLPALVDGRLERVKTRFDPKSRWLLIEREQTLLAANLNGQPCQIDIPQSKSGNVLLTSKGGAEFDNGVFHLPACSVALALTAPLRDASDALGIEQEVHSPRNAGKILV
jgi:maltooligosyltrehalose trehalohydrolase